MRGESGGDVSAGPQGGDVQPGGDIAPKQPE
jgi:hypothetical protein